MILNLKFSLSNPALFQKIFRLLTGAVKSFQNLRLKFPIAILFLFSGIGLLTKVMEDSIH